MTAEEFRALALSCEATVEVGHFERRAFKARRIFASLAPDGMSANICITPEEQEHYVGLQPEAFAPIPNKWGARGWTRLLLDAGDAKVVAMAVFSAWLAASRRRK